MKFQFKSDLIKKIPADIIILAVSDKNQILNNSSLDKPLVSKLNNIIKTGDLSNKVGDTLITHSVEQYSRVILLRVGDQKKLTAKSFFNSLEKITRNLKSKSFNTILISLDQFINKEITMYSASSYLVRAIINNNYCINSQKTSSKEKANSYNVILHGDKANLSNVNLGIKHGEAIANGANLTKDLGNLPPNICTPTYLANQAKKLAKEFNMQVKILDKKQIEKLKMGSFLSVTQGSREAPKFIILEHKKGPKNKKPIVLVGKGITFDAGGISLKPGSAMDEMKYDMCGAATALGVMKMAGLLKLPINLVSVIPACENLPDGAAVKPGDIVKSMSGQTIEILNTDAEGRLVLCDALTYTERYTPDTVIDIATLTGACVIALGHHASAVFSNHEPLAKELLDAGEESLDLAWQMPLWDEYQPLLNSNFADMANIGGRAAGSITAACFLSRYAKKYNWAHLDIAGTAWNSGSQKAATGRPVNLLSQFLIKRASK